MCCGQNTTPAFPLECAAYLTSNCVSYKGPTLVNTNILNGDDFTVVLQKIDAAISGSSEQNNFVRQLLIDENDLPSNYNEQDIIDYILNLPEAERTVAATDSKWNIIVYEPGS